MGVDVTGLFARASRLLVASVVLLVIVAGPASAHDPIILTDRQTTPERGPLLMDGTVSFAVYGTIAAPNDTRGFRVRFAAGNTFVLTALVPDLAPERTLSRNQLPTITLRTPSGNDLTLEPGKITTFAEPFSKTNYRRYLEWSAPAEAGDYGITIIGPVPARFTVSVGVEERFGTAVQDVPNRDAGVAGVMQWYSTPPPTTAVAPTTSAADTTTTLTATPPAGDAALAGDAASNGANDDSGGSVGWIALAAVVIAAAGLTFWWRLRRR